MAGNPLGAEALDTLFREARSYNSWSDAPMTEADIRAIYDLARMGPTSANSGPARFRFAVSADARDRLAACASPANAPKIRKAPVTVIIGYDLAFADSMPKLFPHVDARPWFADPAVARETAFRNSSLQGAYLILAARALGWDAGPMSGFDKAAVDAAFWAGTSVETNFICTLGKGTTEVMWPRLPRLAFEDAAAIL
jgi:3-hydroxypropanoate dehydrogenase